MVGAGVLVVSQAGWLLLVNGGLLVVVDAGIESALAVVLNHLLLHLPLKATILR